MGGPDLHIAIDRTSRVPLYFQVAEALREAIGSGRLPAGSRLDNEIAFADRLGLSRPTMRRAIEYLVDEGLLVRKRGVGTQVVHNQVRRSVELTSLFDDLAASGARPRTTVVDLRVGGAPAAVTEALGLSRRAAVVSLERVRHAGSAPLALMHNYLPEGVVELSAEELRRQGLYALLRAAGVRLRVATQTIGARAASSAEARLLGEKRSAPVLTMTRLTHDDSGRAIEYASHLYRASRYSFELTLRSR